MSTQFSRRCRAHAAFEAEQTRFGSSLRDLVREVRALRKWVFSLMTVAALSGGGVVATKCGAASVTATEGDRSISASVAVWCDLPEQIGVDGGEEKDTAECPID
jgi:hypothetical protein